MTENHSQYKLEAVRKFKNKKTILALVFFIFLVVFFYYTVIYYDISEIVSIGNNEILGYIDKRNYKPKFGIIDIKRYKGLFELNYFIYKDSNEIVNIFLLIDKSGKIQEIATMVDDESIFLKKLDNMRF